MPLVGSYPGHPCSLPGSGKHYSVCVQQSTQHKDPLHACLVGMMTALPYIDRAGLNREQDNKDKVNFHAVQRSTKNYCEVEQTPGISSNLPLAGHLQGGCLQANPLTLPSYLSFFFNFFFAPLTCTHSIFCFPSSPSFLCLMCLISTSHAHTHTFRANKPRREGWLVYRKKKKKNSYSTNYTPYTPYFMHPY